MNRADLSVELETIRIVGNSKNPKLVEQLDEKWFTYLPCRHAITIWKADYRNFEFINFSAYNQEKSFGLTKVAIEEVYEYPMSNSELTDCISIVKRKYRQRLISEKMEEIQGKIFSMSPEETEVELMTYFKNEEVVERPVRRMITDDFEQDNKDLIVIGGTIRPELDDIMPLKKTIITIGADSGHHKSNQAIDMLVLFIQNNPGKKAAFFSFEMDFEEARARLYSKCLKIDLKSIMRRKNKDGSKLEVERLTERMYKEHPLVVSNFLLYDAQDFKKNSDISRILIQEEPVVWALDYLQYYAQMQAENNASEQNKNVMETIAFTKTIAQITNSLGIDLSQIKKFSDTRVTQFPRINDLEWSGLTKQISHSIAMCFWPYKHYPKEVKNLSLDDYYMCAWQKVRNGELWTEELKVTPETCSFEPYNLSKLTYQQKTQINNMSKW